LKVPEPWNTLLISTYKKVLLYVDGEAITVSQQFVSHAGLTWDYRFIYVVAREVEFGTDTYGLVFDRKLNLIRTSLLPGVLGPHQCIYRNDEIFITNTGHNTISAWDGHDNVRTVWRGRERILEDPTTDDHLNSVWYDDQHFYICEHRRGPSKVRVLDHRWKLKDSWDIGEQIHNLFVEEGKAYIGNSLHEGILVRDLETGAVKHVPIIETLDWTPQPVERLIRKAYLRGMAKSLDRFYVGCSAIAPRGDRSEGQSAVAILDNDLNYIDKIVLEDTGALCELRIVDDIDHAHNGIPCPWDGTIPNA